MTIEGSSVYLKETTTNYRFHRSTMKIESFVVVRLKCDEFSSSADSGDDMFMRILNYGFAGKKSECRRKKWNAATGAGKGREGNERRSVGRVSA